MVGKFLMLVVISCEGVMEQVIFQCGLCGQVIKEWFCCVLIWVFVFKGFYDIKVSDIVVEVGVSQFVFYIYFVSKEVVYEVLVWEFCIVLCEVMQ